MRTRQLPRAGRIEVEPDDLERAGLRVGAWQPELAQDRRPGGHEVGLVGSKPLERLPDRRRHRSRLARRPVDEDVDELARRRCLAAASLKIPIS